MLKQSYLNVPEALQPFVNKVVVLENNSSGSTDSFPFYADGCPGILYRESAAAPVLLPRNKALSELFLYGQTLQPIEIVFTAPYRVIVFELQPFVVKMIFGVNPKDLNDDCYNFLADPAFREESLVRKLREAMETEKQAEVLSQFLLMQVERRKETSQQRVALAVHLILQSSGGIAVKQVAEQLNTSERSLQRLFKACVGVSPKQFAKIIQFKDSLSQLSDPKLQTLNELVYKYGYADQSHFIRDFKRFTGDKPLHHKRKTAQDE